MQTAKWVLTLSMAFVPLHATHAAEGDGLIGEQRSPALVAVAGEDPHRHPRAAVAHRFRGGR